MFESFVHILFFSSYNLISFKIVSIPFKVYSISQFEPIITPGNEKYVHHIVLSKCNGSHPELDGKMAVCAGPHIDRSIKWPSCKLFGVWAYGGQVKQLCYSRKS